MIENTELQARLDEFAQHFPEIDFSNVTSGYDQVEKLLLPHLDTFTVEQWKVILDSRYSNLFQRGTPHISWRDERELIIYELINRHNLRPCATWNETWYSVRKYSLKLPAGVILEMLIRDPISWSGGSRTHYYIEITDEFIPVPTHRAVIIGIDTDTRAYITNQFAGTLDECENWVAKHVKGNFFKIMPIE